MDNPRKPTSKLNIYYKPILQIEHPGLVSLVMDNIFPSFSDGALPYSVFPYSANEDQGVLIDGLARLPRDSMIDKKRLASVLGVSTRTVQRMVERHELPPPIRLVKKAMWIVKDLLEHIEQIAIQTAEEARQEEARIKKYSP